MIDAYGCEWILLIPGVASIAAIKLQISLLGLDNSRLVLGVVCTESCDVNLLRVSQPWTPAPVPVEMEFHHLGQDGLDLMTS